jgi:[acyl-carrier-protein] S-malonyltransferase
LAKDAGAKRAMPLPVSGAFHSPLMADAEAKMRKALAATDFQSPKVRFINNVDAEFLTDPDAIKESLARQITGSVRWVDSIERLRDNGAAIFVETGPGRVLQGLIRRIDRELSATGFGAPEELEKAIAVINS